MSLKNPVKKLDAEVARKIAAGEVIDRPNAILITVLYMIVSVALGAAGGIGTLLLGSALLVGFYYAFINGSITHQYSLEDLFFGFKEGLANRILLSILKTIFIFLWSILFIIPGIVKTYSYSLAEYISLQNKDLTWKECLNESRRLMDGHDGRC